MPICGLPARYSCRAPLIQFDLDFTPAARSSFISASTVLCVRIDDVDTRLWFLFYCRAHPLSACGEPGRVTLDLGRQRNGAAHLRASPLRRSRRSRWQAIESDDDRNAFSRIRILWSAIAVFPLIKSVEYSATVSRTSVGIAPSASCINPRASALTNVLLT